jgi:large subunit ribosomal protein L3
VYPNKKMPGHYGVEQVTTQNLTVVDVIGDKNLLLVKGGIAGHNDGIVIVKPAIKSALRESHKNKKA